MPNINLKYLIITVISLSILMVLGSFIFSLIKPSKSPVNQKLNQVIEKQPNKETKQSSGPGSKVVSSEGSKSLSKPILIKSK